MCFGGDDPPQAPNNAPSYSTDQAKAASAAATIAADPTQDDDLKNAAMQNPVSQTHTAQKNSGANFTNIGM